jgi:cell division protein FtsQ
LIVSIEEPLPLARLLTYDGSAGAIEGSYISEEGRFFPVSMNYTARVPLIKGAYFSQRNSLTDSLSRPVLDLLTTLNKDPFWRAQIIEIAIDERRNVIMWPQYGNHQIELGLPTDIEPKLKKLKLFYKHVLTLKDAEHYKRVNVQYRNQIVCE